MAVNIIIKSIILFALTKAQCNDSNMTFMSSINGFPGFNINTNNPMPSCALPVKNIEYNNLHQLQNVQQEAQRRANIMSQESCEEKTRAVNLQREADSAQKQALEAQNIYNTKQDQARKQASIACTIKKEAQEAQQRALNAEMQAQQTHQAAQMHMQQAVRNQIQASQDANLQNETQSLINNIKSTCYESKPIIMTQTVQPSVNYSMPMTEGQFIQMPQESYPQQSCTNCASQQQTIEIIPTTNTVSAPIINFSNESCSKDTNNNLLNSLMGTMNSMPMMSGGCQQGMSSCLIGGEGSMLVPTTCSSNNTMSSVVTIPGSCTISKEDIAVKQLNQCLGKTNKDLQYFAPKGVVNISDVLQLPANGPIPIFSSTCESIQSKQPKMEGGCF